MNTTFNLELNSRPNRYGLHEIFLRITQNKKHKKIKLGIAVKKADFNKKSKWGSWIRNSNPSHTKLNETLENKAKVAKETYWELERENKPLSLQNIKQNIKNTNCNSFYNFANKLLEQFKQSRSINYHKHFRSMILFKLKNYTDKLGFDDLLFSDITVSFLKEYESYLYSIGNKKNTIHKNLSTIRATINDAIEENIINPEDSPFLRLKLSRSPVKKEKLNPEEIKLIEKLDLPENSLLWHSRNIFLFSFYEAGIRASDSIKLKWKNIQKDRLLYLMGKTDKWQNLIIVHKAQEILNYYYKKSKPKAEDFIFPFLKNDIDYSDELFLFNQLSSKNVLINKYLRKIATKVEIEKKLSMHISRHSFASIAKNNKDISTERISELLQHSSTATTKAYLKGFDNPELDKTLTTINE